MADEKETIKTPESQDNSERAYIMTFRDAHVPFRIKGFKHRGDLRSARNRAFKHGTIMGYKNVWVLPLFSDLLAEEQGMAENLAQDGGSDVSPRAHQKEMPI